MKAIKNLAKLPSNNGLRNYSEVVHVTDEYMEYTDGFSLIRVKKEIDLASGCYTKDEMKKELVVPGSAQPKDMTYPDTDRIMPQNTEHVMTVNGKILRNILDVICSDSKKKLVNISIEGGQMKITCEGNVGLALEIKDAR